MNSAAARDGPRHMLFVMTAHLFTTQLRDNLKKINPIGNADGSKINT